MSDQTPAQKVYADLIQEATELRAHLNDHREEPLDLGDIGPLLAVAEAHLTAKIEQLMQMVCPVCGPAIHAANHPERATFGEGPLPRKPDLSA